MVVFLYLSRKYLTTHHLSCSSFTSVSSDQGWRIAVISGPVLSNPQCPSLTEFNNVYTSRWVMHHSSSGNPYQRRHTLLTSHNLSQLLLQMFARVTCLSSASSDLHSYNPAFRFPDSKQLPFPLYTFDN